MHEVNMLMLHPEKTDFLLASNWTLGSGITLIMDGIACTPSEGSRLQLKGLSRETWRYPR